MKYQDVLKRFVSEQAQLLQEKQMKQQMQEQRLAASAQALGSFVPGQQQSPQEEYSETEHNPFEEGQEYKAGGIHIDPSKKGTFKAQATRMNMSIQEAASHILNNRERYSPGMVKKANFAKNFAKEEGGEMYGDPPKKNPYRTQVRASNNLNLANGNTNFNSSSMLIDEYDDGTPSDTSYMHVTPTENVFFSTAVNPETKQKFGQRQSNDKFSQLTPEERKYYQAKIMQELQRKESGGMFTGDYEYPDGGEFDKPRFSVGLNASPEMGSLVSPSLNFEKGKFNANLSTNIPVEMPNRYSKNLNVNANYNTGKFGNIGVSGSAYKDEEGMPAYNAGVRYEVPISDKLNFMLNADTSSFKNLKDNANVSAGLRFNFKEGGDMIRRADGSYSQRGMWDNIRDNIGSGKAPTREMLEQEKRINNKYPDGGDIKSVVENTSGPRTDESYIPMDYLSFINSDQYQPDENEKLFNPATGLGDKVYRQEGNPMSIDYIKSKLADNTTRKDSFNNLDPIHRYYDTELVNSARDSYDTYKQSHLKQKVEGEVQNYPDMENVIKGAYEHNLKNGYDDTDVITSHLGNQAKKEGLDIYDFMAKYYGGSSPNAVARQLLVDYSKKMKK